MQDTCTAMQGVGLAANQIGMNLRIALIAEPKKKPFFIVNPKIVELGEEVEDGQEGCLSCPGKFGNVKRSKYVTIDYQELDGSLRRGICCDYEARIVQHEIDHLNNVLCVERMTDAKQTN